jgi:RimJ/RimL family protein N-acetyltransferase
MLRRRRTRKAPVRLQGQRIAIRPMRRSDLDGMERWRPFADPLYAPFGYPQRSAAERDRWFRWRSTDPTRALYVIEDEQQQVIGSLTLRDISARQSARLGITLGADFVSQGYGTEALRCFLDYFFGSLGFEKMVLDVAAINQRAIRCYRRLGFAQTGQHYQATDSTVYETVSQVAGYRHLRRFFRDDGLRPRLLFYDMQLTREAWRADNPAAQHQSPPAEVGG